MSRNPMGEWYTQGQTKCPDCGDYYPEGWASHGAACPRPKTED